MQACHVKDVMRKSGVSRSAGRKQQRRPRPAELSGTVEGQIAEICHELAAQAKRMKQLEQQAQELRTTLRLWAGPSGADFSRAD
jgi:transposase